MEITKKHLTTGKLTYHFSRTYWVGGYKYSDWFSLHSCSNQKFYRGYYANLGSMVSEISQEQFLKFLVEWNSKPNFNLSITHEDEPEASISCGNSEILYTEEQPRKQYAHVHG